MIVFSPIILLNRFGNENSQQEIADFAKARNLQMFAIMTSSVNQATNEFEKFILFYYPSKNDIT